MAYVLYGATYVGTGTLPTPVPGFGAKDIVTGNVYESNTAGTLWTLVGNVNTTNLGLFPQAGGAVGGAITGPTGWATVDSHNFPTVVKRNGIDLVDTNQLSNMQSTITASIAPKITEAVASLSSGISVSTSIAMASGLMTFTNNTPQTIPRPQYPGDRLAYESECKWHVGLVGGGWPCGRSDGNGDTTLYHSADPSTTRTFAMYLKDNGGNYYTTVVAYFIIGVKS